MIALIQRVISASVEIDTKVIGKIVNGLLVFLGVRESDTFTDVHYLVNKTVNLRIFNDEQGKMNLSLLDKGYNILVVSQFTLHADTKHGNRPSYTLAAKEEQAENLYLNFLDECKKIIGEEKVQCGIFGAMMKVKLNNDGPVTIILKSKNEF